MSHAHCFYAVGNRPTSAVYRWEGRYAAASYVLPALLELGVVPSEPNVRFHGFVTPDVRRNRESFEESLRACVEPSVVERVVETWDDDRYRIDRSTEGTERIVDRILSAVQPGDTVLLEITQGLRNVQIALLLGAGLLASLRGARPRVFYADLGAESDLEAPEPLIAQLEPNRRQVSPVHDLGPLVDLFRWTNAVEAMRRSLDARPLSDLLQEVRGTVAGNPATPGGRDFLTAATALRNLGPALALGWPRQVASALAGLHETRAILEELEAPSHAAGALAGFHALRVVLNDLSEISGLETPQDQLDERRLRFELRLVKKLRDAQRQGDALRILREWFVNAQILADAAGPATAEWLSPKDRRAAEGSLWTAAQSDRSERQEVGRAWGRVTDSRNAVAHAGARQQTTKVATLERVLSEVPTWLDDLFDSDWRAAFRSDPARPVRSWLANAFSLNMVADLEQCTATITPMSLEEAREIAAESESVVGHPPTASRFGEILGLEVPCRRETLALRRGDRVLVGQYVGPRLPVDATELPGDATIRWVLVTVEGRP